MVGEPFFSIISATSKFLKHLKRISGKYKLIVFYPGKSKAKLQPLFGLVNDENSYTGPLLNQ